MSEVNPITTPQDVLLQKQQAETFAKLLMKCLSMDVRRHPDRREQIYAFCQQAISDSKYLIIGRLPDDIVQTIKEAKNKKKEADLKSQ